MRRAGDKGRGVAGGSKIARHIEISRFSHALHKIERAKSKANFYIN